MTERHFCGGGYENNLGSSCGEVQGGGGLLGGDGRTIREVNLLCYSQLIQGPVPRRGHGSYRGHTRDTAKQFLSL